MNTIKIWHKTQKEKVDNFINYLKKILNTDNIIFNEWNFFNDWDLTDSSFLIDWEILLMHNNDILDNDFFLTIQDNEYETIINKAKEYYKILSNNNIDVVYDEVIFE